MVKLKNNVADQGIVVFLDAPCDAAVFFCEQESVLFRVISEDMTVYQLWDTFARLRSNDVYECGKTAVSVWGDKEHKFDFNSWYKNITN